MAALLAAPALPAPVRAVTVYSDRARVTRSARVPGEGRYELPILPQTVDPSTIVVDVSTESGLSVTDIEIEHIPDVPLKPEEARGLVFELEATEVAQQKLEGQIAARSEIVAAVRKLTPSLPASDAQRPYPKLLAGPLALLGFVKSFTEKNQQRLLAENQALVEVRDRRRFLQGRAAELLVRLRKGGYRVTPTLSGKAGGQISLSYQVTNARWVPTYDIQLDPVESKVALFFAGRVSQNTGEDWEGATLTLSTAIPATTTEVPRLYTWKLGERERFIPTPSPHMGQVRPAKSVDRAAPVPKESEMLLSALSRHLQEPQKQSPDESKWDNKRGKDVAQEVDQKSLERAPVVGRTFQSVLSQVPGVAARPSAPPPPPEPKPEAPTPNARRDSGEATIREEAEYVTRTVDSSRSTSTGRWQAPTVTKNLGLLPPPSYTPPPLPVDSPAMEAGGYDLTYRALAKETVRSGKGDRRVALFSKSFPVRVFHRLYPALSQEAYLVAELKNPLSQALPGGLASLAVGGDPAGSAHLKVVAPLETFTLPLGLDRNVKPIRNVYLQTSEKGVFSKDEITEYTVTTEVANPYTRPLSLRVTDQLPLTQDRQVEIRLLKADPKPTVDPVKGVLDYQLSVPPRGKAVVRYVYSLKRPKDSRMIQRQTPAPRRSVP